MSVRLERRGRIVALAGGRAQIRLEPATDCAQCGSRGSCAGGKAAQPLLELALGDAARVGDEISLSTPAASFLRAALLGYLLPALGVLLGAVGGECGFGGDAAAVAGALAGFAAALVVARLVARRALAADLRPVAGRVSPFTGASS